MKTRLIVLLLLVAALCCVAQDVRYNFASGEDFSKYIRTNGSRWMAANELIKWPKSS